MPVRKQQVQNPTILWWRSNKICVIGCWPHDTPAAEAAAVAAVHMVENVEHKIIGRLPPHHTTAAWQLRNIPKQLQFAENLKLVDPKNMELPNGRGRLKLYGENPPLMKLMTRKVMMRNFMMNEEDWQKISKQKPSVYVPPSFASWWLLSPTIEQACRLLAFGSCFQP